MKKVEYDKSIQEIENNYWKDYDLESFLIQRCHNLRKVKINDLTIEDIRLLLGQNIGNNLLIPIAINYLKINILSEGDYYEGDLLLNVLTSDKKYWINNRERYQEVIELIKKNRDKLTNVDTTKEIRNLINNAIEYFIQIQKEK